MACKDIQTPYTTEMCLLLTQLKSYIQINMLANYWATVNRRSRFSKKMSCSTVGAKFLFLCLVIVPFTKYNDARIKSETTTKYFYELVLSIRLQKTKMLIATVIYVSI